MPGPHDTIIANAAKLILRPIGFVRKGRSRTWIADHGWWATVVEFQPSSWSKGCYLNVAAHWLWSNHDFLSFDFGGRLEEHVKYESDAQFEQAASSLAEKAASESRRLAGIFNSIASTASFLVAHETPATHGGWSAYHAGVAAGLAGLHAEAAEMFSRAVNGLAAPALALAQSALRMAELIQDQSRFRIEVNSLIETHRENLRLPPLSEPSF